MNSNQKGFATLVVLLSALCLAAIGAGTYLYIAQVAKPKPAAVIKKTNEMLVKAVPSTQNSVPVMDGQQAVTSTQIMADGAFDGSDPILFKLKSASVCILEPYPQPNLQLTNGVADYKYVFETLGDSSDYQANLRDEKFLIADVDADGSNEAVIFIIESILGSFPRSCAAV
jgi:hypothetical protein